MQKPNVYEKIPQFNQQTQMVVQLPPIEREDDIYHGVKVVDLPEVEEVEEE